MKSAYLVTENPSDAEILKQILPLDVIQTTEVVVAQGAYAARSLAGTILSERMRPVALVVNAGTHSEMVDEHEQTIKSLLLPASSGIPYEVCVAVPTLEELLMRALENPQRSSITQISLLERLEQAETEQLQSLQLHPLIQRLLQFLRFSDQQVA